MRFFPIKKEYEGPLKPCPHCGSMDVVYVVSGTYGRLGCMGCDKWLESEAYKVEEIDEREE